ncbi:MAG: COX aromatic rich motif-containing protein [Verrucomicrobiota bacterium]|nr:COX aromatic rich motif-containing protein [Verrucomicrobiota bacterium]
MRVFKPVVSLLLLSGLILLAILLLQFFELSHFQSYIAILFPKGMIGVKEADLLLIIQAIMLIVVFPVYLFTFLFSWLYRSDNPHGIYDPDLIDHRVAEYFWWGTPLVLTAVICSITVIRTYQLDPFKPIVSDVPAKRIQVVALQWKWLFIYPEEKIASLNFVQLPLNTPIHFEITADAPMNSFWIPHLGSQIYAMPKMRSELYLIADAEGDFPGYSANISGTGFSDMHFIARVSNQEAFEEWVALAKKSSENLDIPSFELLARPQEGYLAPKTYRLQDETLFDYVLMKYMYPQAIQ